MERERTALVLGATGGIGGEVAAALLARGWAVRGLQRDPAAAAAGSSWLRGVAWVQGDAMNPGEVADAARGTALIVHAVSPPGYRRWAELVLPMLESSIAAARASGARILLPGTVYNYRPDTSRVVDEAAPQQPLTRKGRIRVEMERRLQAASADRVRTLIVRAGDFFGPHTGNSWFSQGLVKPGRPVRAIAYPGAPGAGHAWAYLPDLAEAMVRLVERGDALEPFARFHFAGHWDADGTAMTSAIRRVVGAPAPRLQRFPWWLVTAAWPFVPLFREVREVRPLWQMPLRLDNRRLLGLLGAEPHTPLDAAVRATLAGLGCLPATPAPLPSPAHGPSMEAG